MEILVWLFLGLMVFIAWLVFINYRIDERKRGERQHQRARVRAWREHHDRAYWEHAEAEAARLRERADARHPPPANARNAD